MAGTKYVVPVNNFSYPMYVNMDILKAAGVETLPTTWSELIDVCKKVTDAGYSAFALNLGTTNANGIQNVFGGTYEQVITAIRAGFTSVMIDASSQPYEGNVATCKKVCEAAHAVNVSVEGELGTIGNTDSVETTAPDQILYTDPQQAKDFIEKTGIDCLAIAIGTCHGIYPKDKKPELRIDILKEIKKVVSVPLVLHGGSSNKDEEIAKSVDNGVNKINISSDIKVAYYNKMREVLADASLREPNQIQPPCMAAMKEVCYDKIKLFKADGKASLY